jgi:hypothetical protein
MARGLLILGLDDLQRPKAGRGLENFGKTNLPLTTGGRFMKRMAPLLVIFVLVLAPAAWGYHITLSNSAGTIGFGVLAQINAATDSGGVQTLSPTAGVFFSQTSVGDTNTLATPPDSRAQSNWVAMLYDPIVTWDPDGVGKTTTIKQVINVSMLLSFVDPDDTGRCGTSGAFQTSFSAVREDPSTHPIVTLELSTNQTGQNLSPTFSTSFRHFSGGGMTISYEDIIPKNNAPPAVQTASSAGIAVLESNTDFFQYALDVTALLDKAAPDTIDPSDPSTFVDYSGDLIVTETLNFYEPNIVNPTPIPVPPSLILFGSSLLGLGFMVRRRQS